ncbi:MAG: SMP-30/gluconolactonase/LRE family protein [Armatimonadaceae bacterium]
MNRRDFLKVTTTVSAATLTGTAEAALEPAPQQTQYTLTPDSERQEGVPQGKVTRHRFTGSRIFPGTERDYWIYVPAQYDPGKPACVMVFQDGGGFQDTGGGYRVPIVFDNLIHKNEMPVTIGVFINPGVVPAANPETQLPRYNRSYEYDALSDQYARFLIEELLPEVAKSYKLTDDPNGRAISGASSGGICAFTAAWERPDYFRKVLSFIGSFTDLRGGNTYPDLIRKREPKPIRVFMQDGSNDLDIYSGSWFIGNNDVAAALRFAGYDYQYVVGDGGHNGNHGRAILPDALRWLWRDYAGVESKIKAEPRPASRQPVMNLVSPEEDWEPFLPAALQSLAPTQGSAVRPVFHQLCADAQGQLYILLEWRDNARRQRNNTGPLLVRLSPDGREVTRLISAREDGITPSCFGIDPEGRIYVANSGKREIVVLDPQEKRRSRKTRATNVEAEAMVVTHNGHVYTTSSNRLFHIAPDGKVEAFLPFPNRSRLIVGERRLQLSPDQSLLFASPPPRGEKFVTSFQIQPNGSLSHGQEYFDLHVRYGFEGTGAMGTAVDTNGWLYVSTDAGIQVCDQAGRVNAIIAPPVPHHSPEALSLSAAGFAASLPTPPVASLEVRYGALAFAGPEKSLLYCVVKRGALAGDSLYRRKTKAKGVVSSEPPLKPPAPRL